MNSGVFSFNIRTARDLYEKLSREARELERRPTDSALAWNVAVTAYHLYEWFWHQQLQDNDAAQRRLFGRPLQKSEFRKELYQNCPHFEIMRDLGDGSKHFVLTQVPPKRVAATRVRRGAFAGHYIAGDTLMGEKPNLAITLKDGGRISFAAVVAAVLAMWDGLFAGLGDTDP